MMRVPVTMSPHVQKGKATGYYLVAQRLFDKPVRLLRDQFAGYCEGLVVTVGGIEHLGWNTVLSMAIHLPVLGGKPVNWLTAVKQTNCAGGFRVYLPGKDILMPDEKDKTVHLWGEFETVPVGNTRLCFLRVPLVDGDILLGRRRLGDVERS